MNLNIGKIDIDFEVIPTYNPQKLWIGDSSKWFGAENLPATICITPPGGTKSINNIFQKHKLNIFNSVNLNLSCVTECDEQLYIDLPDGIWTINLKSGYEGLEKTRYYLKTDQFTNRLDKVYIRSGLEFDKNNKQFREDLSDIEFLVRTAEAWTRDGSWVNASRDFTQAQDLLSKYEKCKNCI